MDSDNFYERLVETSELTGVIDQVVYHRVLD